MNNSHDSIIKNLLKGCLENDRKSQRKLYELYYGYGMSVCIRYSENKDEAVELLNDSYMKLFIHIKKFDLKKPFKPWFRKIIVNTCINNFKKKKVSFNIDLDEAKNVANTNEILEGISYKEILNMIKKLSPAYRTVFNLYAIEGYKHEEIANMLEISVGTSKSNLFKAKKQLKVILQEYFLEDYEQAKQG